MLTARVPSASWDLFFAHLSEWIHVEATGKGQATAVLTGDKRLGELRAMTSWAGKAPGCWGFQRVEFSDLFAPASLPRAVQWLEELNSSVERRAAAGTLVADRNRMLDWMADYLLRTHDPEWTQLLEDGPSVAYD